MIIENLQTGLAFTHMSDTMLIMMLGYGVDVLNKLPWLSGLPCYYWGDIDTHGFAILSRLRTYFPQVRSLLMDEKTLLRHKMQWGKEDSQCPTPLLSGLTPEEQSVYQNLREQRWCQNLRLEQERIDWGYAIDFMNHEIEAVVIS